MDFKNDKVRGVLLGVAFGLMAIVLVFRIPVLIDLHFRYLKLIDHCNTTYTSSDILQYYGILLGAAAAIVAVLMTINYSRKTSEESRIEVINAEYRKIGIDTCLKMIDIFSIQTFKEYREKIINEETTNLDNDLKMTKYEADILIKNFKNIYHDLEYDIEEFYQWYHSKIYVFLNKYEKIDSSDIVELSSFNADIEKLRDEHEKKYETVRAFIIDTMTTYNVYKKAKIKY